MAFDIKQFERVAGGAKKLAIYHAGADTAATVTGSGYFNEIAQEVDKGDVILVGGANLTTIDVVMVTSLRGVTPVTTVATEGITAT